MSYFLKFQYELGKYYTINDFIFNKCEKQHSD